MTHRPYLVGLVGTGVGPVAHPGAAHGRGEAPRAWTTCTCTIDLNAAGVAPERIGEVLDWARALGFDALNVTHPCKRLVDRAPRRGRRRRRRARRGEHRDLRRASRGRIQHRHDRFRARIHRGPARCGHRQRGADRRGRRRCRRRRRAAAPRCRPPHDRRRRRRTGHRARQRARRRCVPRPESTRRRPEKLAVLLPASDGVVHCTPTGMAEHPGMPFSPDAAAPRPVGGRHRLPAAGHRSCSARRSTAGCRVCDGGHMAVHQATEAFALITGITPDAERMSRHFRRLVG